MPRQWWIRKTSSSRLPILPSSIPLTPKTELQQLRPLVITFTIGKWIISALLLSGSAAKNRPAPVFTLARTHTASHRLLHGRIECSRVERVGWGWRGCGGWRGESIFWDISREEAKKQDECVGIDVMEGDGIKRRWRGESTLKSAEGQSESELGLKYL